MPRPADDETYRNSAKFADFVRRYEPTLTQHVARIYAELDTRAIVADVFAVAWRRFGDIPMNRAEQWLKSTAFQSARNMRRSDRRWRSLKAVARTAARTSLNVVDDSFRLEAHVVAVGLSQLSADDRALLRLQALEGPSTEELAAILGTSPEAARTRLSRARQRLHDACERLISEGSA
jgi:RNA polymerase sigma factor (sigma-70 family)